MVHFKSFFAQHQPELPNAAKNDNISINTERKHRKRSDYYA
jgi:hypothetical protein